MNHVLIFMAPVAAAIIALGSWAGFAIYRRHTGLTRWQSAFLWLVAVALAAISIDLPGFGPLNRQYLGEPQEPVLIVASFILFWLLVVPFSVALYRKWIGGHLSDAEELPGMDGVRAWLTPGNLVCAIFIPICAWQAFNYSLPGIFALTFGLLLAYPILNMASTSSQPAPAAPVEDLAAEREKVLELLEAGKISADESAELLNALGHSVPQQSPVAIEMKLSPARKIVLLGAALLLIGFFLPWFNINIGQELNAAAAQVQQMIGGMMPGNMMPRVNTGTVQVHGGDVAHGIGWWILALGIGAAVLPFFATTLKSELQKKVILAALAVGGFLLIYLLYDTLRYVSIGVVLVLAAYALEFVGTLKERSLPR